MATTTTGTIVSSKEGERNGGDGAGASSTSYKVHKRDESVMEPFDYLVKVPGKNVRGKLVDAFNLWLKIPDDKVRAIKDIISMLHTASLLIDDIEDNSTMRRGIPCAHKVYGIPNTINTANYVYFLALEKTHLLGSERALSVYLAELLNLHRGQGQDISWRESCACPTMDAYKKMVKDKTGGLFRLAVRLMSCFSDQTFQLVELVDLLALYFQIRDDFINLADSNYMEQKTFCEDLTEGKFSFVIIHAIRNSPKGDNRVLNILKQRVTDPQIKKYAVKCMWELGSFHFTRRTLKSMHDRIHETVRSIGMNEVLLTLLGKLDAQLDGLLDVKKSPLARELSDEPGHDREGRTGVNGERRLRVDSL
eukprot:g4670.t1